MDATYDVIVLGTGLEECVISGLLSTQKQSVLHLDRHDYYGGEAASLNLNQLFQRFNPEATAPESFGRSRDYNVDVSPKLIMACGHLVKMLLSTQVTKYLDFKSIGGSFIVKSDSIHRVPATPIEATTSSLLGFFDKVRSQKFLEYVSNWEETDPSTHDGVDASKASAADLLQKFGLTGYTGTFIGHTLALFLDDSYLERPAKELIERMKLYAHSLARYGSSPYIYPLYGISGLSEGFSRLCAVNGGVYMLNVAPEEILYDDGGKVRGVRTATGTALCKKLVGDPSYFIGTDKVKKVGEVAHSICFLNHAVPNTGDTDSCQIIIPACEISERKSDIYISVVSSNHQVCPKGRYIAHVSATVETADPHKELLPALKLLGAIDQEFFWVSERYVPTSDGSADNVIISQSLDATSHFETSTVDIESMYQRLTGKQLDLSIVAEVETSMDQ